MLTKDLINNMAGQTGMTKKRTEELLDATTHVILKSLMEGKTVQLQNLGVLEVKERKERTIILPKSGERVITPAKRQLSFRPMVSLKNDLKQLDSHE